MQIAALLIIGSFAAAIPLADAQPKLDAGAIVAAAREALGGEKRLSAVRSFSLTGRTHKGRGETLVPVEFEILCELPDRCVRKDAIPAQEGGPTTIGFNGVDLIQLPASDAPPAREGAPPRNPAQEEAARKMRVTSVKQDFVRLTLGMFAGSFPRYPLTFTHAGQLQTPQGPAHVVEARGPDNFVVRLFVDSTSHLPIMISWIPPAPPVSPGAVMAGAARGAGAERQPGGPSPRQAGGAAPPAPSPTAPQSDQPAVPPAGAPSTAPAKPLESRVYYADYRKVDGLQLPFRLRHTAGGETVEEMLVDRYRINPRIDPGRFEVRQ